MAQENEENMIKIEYYEEDTQNKNEHDDPAQALMTLHDSVQKMPSKQKTALQVAVADASPQKRVRINSSESYQPFTHYRLKQYSPLRFQDPRRISPEFSQEQLEIMNKYYASINNTLKQPTGRRWACYEWFYSNIDRALLLGTNDFEDCLQQMFRNLKTRSLTRSQWSLLRRMMGKPRRCSEAFLKEERALLEEKRKKIRYLHQLKGFEINDMLQFKDLPDEIPMPMVIGTKVTAKLPPNYSNQNGSNLFTGIVDAVDTANNTYRINFDREGIGSHSIPDTDVASDQYEAMNLQLFIVKERPKLAHKNSPGDSQNVGGRIEKEGFSSTSPARLQLKEALNNESTATYGGFPIRFLLHITKLSKAIALKKDYIDRLRELNSDIELRQPFGGVTREFQKNYACLVLELEKLNTEMDNIFDKIETYMRTEAPQMDALDQSMNVRSRCNAEAAELIEQSEQIVQDEKMRVLTLKFMSLMLQINHVAKREESCSSKLLLLDQSVNDIKDSLCPENRKLFEDKVETSIAFLKNGLQEEQSMLAAFTSKRRKFKKPSMVVERNSSAEENYDDLRDEDDLEEELDDEEGEEEEIKDEDVFELL